MKCKCCSENIDDSSKFCPFCGEKINISDAEAPITDITSPLIDVNSDDLPGTENTKKDNAKENKKTTDSNLNTISKKEYFLIEYN